MRESSCRANPLGDFHRFAALIQRPRASQHLVLGRPLRRQLQGNGPGSSAAGWGIRHSGGQGIAVVGLCAQTLSRIGLRPKCLQKDRGEGSCPYRMELDTEIKMARPTRFETDFAPERARLTGATREGLVNWGDRQFEMTPLGWFFVQVMAMVFDRHLAVSSEMVRLSRII